jgi:hypothetical protein
MMLLLLAAILGLAWLFGLAVFHIASGSIHLLLVLAAVAVVVYFVQAGRRRGSSTT